MKKNVKDLDLIPLEEVINQATFLKLTNSMHPSILSQFIKVNNRNIHYLTAGEGEPILLLHGWPTSAFLWRKMMPVLSEKYQVIAIDLPGFGKSEKKVEDSYSFRYYEEILSGFIKQLGLEKLTLGIHDLGGPLGLFWAIQNPNKVKRLILFNTLVYPQFSRAVKLFGLATRLPFLKDKLTSPKGIMNVMFFGIHQKKALRREAILEYQSPFKTKPQRKVLLKTVQNLHKNGFKEIEAKLTEFKIPTLIIYGENDRILPNVAQTVSRVKVDIPHAQVVSLPNCGHFLQEEEPEKISEIILDFMV